MADGAPSRAQALGLQGQSYLVHVGVQAALGHQRHHEKHFYPPALGHVAGDSGNGITGPGDQGHHHRHHQEAAHKACFFAARFAVKAALQEAHKPPGDDHGMGHDTEQKRHAAHYCFHCQGDQHQEQEMRAGKGIYGGELRHLSRLVCRGSFGQSSNDLRPLTITT